MHEQHRTTDQGYSLVEGAAGVPVLHLVLDQLRPLTYKECLRCNGDSKHYDHADALVNDNILKRRGR